MPIPGGLPIDADASATRLVARLRMALRVRALHATVLRRMETFSSQDGTVPVLPQSDPVDDATVLVAGRGRSYPELAVAVGERVGLIGALSVETAAKYLNARDVDGVVIGDGFSPKVVEALLTAMSEDARFRDLPIALASGTPALIAEFGPKLANLETADGDPRAWIDWILPLVRLHAFDARLKRVMQSFDSKGMIDPQTGLLTREAFWCDLSTAMQQAAQRGVGLSVARFTFGAGAGTPRQPRYRATGQPHRAQHRFRLPGLRRFDPLRLHRHRPTRRPCDLAAHRQRAQAHHAHLRTPDGRSSRPTSRLAR